MKFILKKRFSAAHFYHQENWSEQKNREVFGKCFTRYGHGHDYALEVELEGLLQTTVQSAVDEVIEKIDHQHLNFVIADFKHKIPTTENLALYLEKEIKATLAHKKAEVQIVQLRLFETPEIWVEIN